MFSMLLASLEALLSVYFVLRSQYESPNICRIKMFDENSVLDWFRKYWKACDFNESYEYVAQLLGFSVYGFPSIFRAIREHSLGKPSNSQELEKHLRKHLYFEGDMHFHPHAIQVFTDDDELDLVYYIFDDEYVESNKEKCTFILRNEWKLPTESRVDTFVPKTETTILKPPGPGAGAVFCVFMSAYEWGGQIADMDKASCIQGIRLPELAAYLGSKELGTGIDVELEFPSELLLIRSQLLVEPELVKIADGLLQELEANASQTNTWTTFYAELKTNGVANPEQFILRKALENCSKYPVHSLNRSFNWKFEGAANISISREQIEKVIPPSQWKNDSGKSLIQVDEHIAQASMHTDVWPQRDGTIDLYNRWILFDDLWAAANEDLANSILRFQASWDVLSTDEDS